jgi:hypothetical protein
MPEFKLPEVRIPGLRDMNTDDIKQSMADVPRPDIKLSDLDPRRVDFPKIDLSRLDLSRLDLSKLDLAGAANAAAARNPLRKRQPSRLPILLTGLVVAALGVFAILNVDWLRARATDVGQRVKSRIDAARVNDSLERIEGDEDSYSASVGIPVQADDFAGSLPTAGTPVETGYGSSFDTGSGDGGSQTEVREEGEVKLYGN